MTSLTIPSVLLLLASAIVVWLYTRRNLRFVRSLSSRLQDCPPANVPDQPHVLILLCLKGSDPFLQQSISSLASQNYPQCTVRLVIDSPTDECWESVTPLLAQEFRHAIETQIRRSEPTHCSGKIANLLEGTEDLEGIDYVMIVDGDSLLPDNAISHCVSHLNDPQTGLVTGNRWYFPPDTKAGSILRAQWNGFAVPIMHQAQIPWGGCLMLPAQWLADPDVRDRLGRAFGEDSFFSAECLSRGLKVRLEPSLILPNRESIGFGSLYQFLVRQNLTVRINNPRWESILGSSLGLSIVFSMLIATSLIPSAGQWSAQIAVMIISPIVIGQQIWLERVIRAHLKDHFSYSATQSLLWWICLLPMLVLNILVTLQAILKLSHTWRGRTYHFDVENHVRVVPINALLVNIPATEPAVALYSDQSFAHPELEQSSN